MNPQSEAAMLRTHLDHHERKYRINGEAAAGNVASMVFPKFFAAPDAGYFRMMLKLPVTHWSQCRLAGK
jgi:hypothetical protein